MSGSHVARYNMIDGQLEPNQVLDEQVVAAMGITPRELFVPDAYKASAYVDAPLPVGHGRYLLPPVVLGRLVQAADVHQGDKALVVGAMTGYAAVVLAHLGAQVVALEEHRELADKARQILADMGQKAVEVKTSSLHMGCESQGPYDVVLIDGAAEEIPESLMQQVAVGGCLLAVRSVARRPGEAVGLGRAVKRAKTEDGVEETVLFDANVALIPAFRQEEPFRF